MIHVLTCRCANAEPLARKLLASAHYKDWLKQPIVKGKQECLNFLATLPENLEVGSLREFIKGSSSWSVILGDKNGTFRWSNISDGVKGRLDAEIIVEKFGNG